MSETQTAPVTEQTPPAFDPAASESVADYRQWVADGRPEPAKPTETPAAAPAPEAQAESEPEGTPDPASEAGKQLAAKKGSLQARINDLTREKHESKREAEAAKAEAARLQAELDALKRGSQPAAEPKTPSADPTRPKLAAFTEKIGSEYEDYESAVVAWKDADDDWKQARQREASAQDAATRARQEVTQAYTTRLAAFKARTPDFDAVVTGSMPISEAIEAAVLLSEKGPEIAYYLGSHLDDLSRIVALPPIQQAIAIGKIEATLSSPSRPADATPGPSVVAPVSQAPEPIKPVGSGGTGASTADPSEIHSVRDWEKNRDRFLQ